MIFRQNSLIPKYLEKNQKAFEIILVVFQCVIFPIISIVITCVGEQRPVAKSLSYIAYRENRHTFYACENRRMVAPKREDCL